MKQRRFGVVQMAAGVVCEDLLQVREEDGWRCLVGGCLPTGRVSGTLAVRSRGAEAVGVVACDGTLPELLESGGRRLV